MAWDPDPRQVEIIGRNWLAGELVRAGPEVADPARDNGVDPRLKRVRVSAG